MEDFQNCYLVKLYEVTGMFTHGCLKDVDSDQRKQCKTMYKICYFFMQNVVIEF